MLACMMQIHGSSVLPLVGMMGSEIWVPTRIKVHVKNDSTQRLTYMLPHASKNTKHLYHSQFSFSYFCLFNLRTL